jgi:hypothetical protein
MREDMSNWVRLIQELSPKSLDQLVSWRKVCSVRIVVVRLNQLGMPAQAFDDTYGDAKLLLNTIEIIRERFKCGLIRMSRYRVYWSRSQVEKMWGRFDCHCN